MTLAPHACHEQAHEACVPCLARGKGSNQGELILPAKHVVECTDVKHVCAVQSCVCPSMSNTGSTKLAVNVLRIDALHHPYCFTAYLRLAALKLSSVEKACARDNYE